MLVRGRSLPSAIKEMKAPIQSRPRKYQSTTSQCPSERWETPGSNSLIPMHLPPRFQISKYGGRIPAPSSIAAITPTAVIGQLIPRAYGSCGLSVIGPSYARSYSPHEASKSAALRQLRKRPRYRKSVGKLCIFAIHW